MTATERWCSEHKCAQVKVSQSQWRCRECHSETSRVMRAVIREVRMEMTALTLIVTEEPHVEPPRRITPGPVLSPAGYAAAQRVLWHCPSVWHV